MRVAVVGGTGAVGRHVIDLLTAAGHEPLTFTRAAGVDVLSGRGLDAAMADVDVVIDVANVATTSRSTSVGFFTATTRNLLEAERQAGVRHHVALSIVGIDDLRLGGYYEGKRRQEAAVVAGSVPWSILRTTQFHEFAGQILKRAGVGRVSVVPRMRLQPVAAREAAAALAELALGPAAGRAPELAGPAHEDLVDMARRVVRARCERRVVIPLRLPGRAGAAVRGGALLPSPGARRSSVTFADWLAHP